MLLKNLLVLFLAGLVTVTAMNDTSTSDTSGGTGGGGGNDTSTSTSDTGGGGGGGSDTSTSTSDTGVTTLKTADWVNIVFKPKFSLNTTANLADLTESLNADSTFTYGCQQAACAFFGISTSPACTDNDVKIFSVTVESAVRRALQERRELSTTDYKVAIDFSVSQAAAGGSGAITNKLSTGKTTAVTAFSQTFGSYAGSKYASPSAAEADFTAPTAAPTPPNYSDSGFWRMVYFSDASCSTVTAGKGVGWTAIGTCTDYTKNDGTTVEKAKLSQWASKSAIDFETGSTCGGLTVTPSYCGLCQYSGQYAVKVECSVTNPDASDGASTSGAFEKKIIGVTIAGLVSLVMAM